MVMKTSIQERVTRILLGLGLVVCGYFFILPLKLPAVYLGLMIVGFGIDPRGTEYPEDNGIEGKSGRKTSSVPSKQVPAEMPSANSKVAAKKPSRKKKAPKSA